MSNCDEAEFAKTAEYNPAVGMVVFIKASCPNETMRSRIGVIVEGPLEGVDGGVLFNIDNGKEIELVLDEYVNPIGDVYSLHKDRLSKMERAEDRKGRMVDGIFVEDGGE